MTPTQRTRQSRWAGSVLALSIVLAVSACADDTDPSGPSGPERPAEAEAGVIGEEWPTTSPRRAGVDPGALNGLYDRARGSDSFCTLLTRDGRLVGERYFGQAEPATTHQVYSVTKSVTSVLVGIAQDEGMLDVDDPASQWIPEWSGTPAAKVTVRDLLSNDSGRAWSRDIDYSRLLTESDRTGFAVGLRQANPPGTVWAYNNSAIQTLEAVLEAATGEDVGKFAYDRLFTPLGMDDTSMGFDPAGNTLTFAGVTSTCRDLARFGQLMLHKGRWGDEQIVSSDWVAASTGKASTKLNAAYGYLWWVNRSGVLTDPLTVRRLGDLDDRGVPRGRHVPGAPADTFWAQGLGGQVVQVDPASQTVVVRIGPVFPPEGVEPFGAEDAAQVLRGVS